MIAKGRNQSPVGWLLESLQQN